MKILICDNDKHYCTELEDIITDYVKQRLSLDVEIDVFYSGESLLRTIKANIERYQILFLDIEMDTMNGIETAREIRKQDKNLMIIYVTSYEKYTLGSFEVSPFRYVLKPIKRDEIEQVLLKAVEEVEKANQYLFFSYRHTNYQLKTINIISVTLEKGRMIRITTVDNNEYSFYGKIRDIKSKLNSFYFVKINQGTIINLDHVHIISKDVIHMNDGSIYSISRGEKRLVKRTYRAYMQRKIGI